MTDRFDPNIPPAGPTDPSIEGEFTGIVATTERPTLGKSNLVVNRDESQGPGDEITLGSVNVPVGGPGFSLDEAYSAKLKVAANTLNEENPGTRTSRVPTRSS